MILHTEVTGSGEGIVFLHSGLQTGTTDFVQQQAIFAQDFQVIRPDLRGHGQSASSDTSNFFEASAKDLEDTLESLELHSVHLVGASLGALVALFFAKRFPNRVKSLTISGVTKNKPENWLELHQEEAAAQASLLEDEKANAFLTELHGAGWVRFIEMGKDHSWYPFHETRDLSTITAPVLVIAGEGNPNEAQSALAYAAESEKTHAAIVPFASHLVHVEQPECYTQVIEEFIRDVQTALPN